jgi:hypothetical protein
MRIGSFIAHFEAATHSLTVIIMSIIAGISVHHYFWQIN